MQTIPRPEHPRPDFIRPDWLNLNGEWQFAFDDANAGLKEKWYMPEKTLDRTIIVPFCFESKASGVGLNERHDTIWYRRKFAVPAEMQGKRVWVRFGAVDFECTVYVNGNAVGFHRGGYTPFSVDATPFLQDGENDLCLRVSDPRDCTQPRGKQNWFDKWFGCWYVPTSGVWQTVYLEAVADNAIQTAHVTPDIDAGAASLRVTLERAPETPIEAKFTLTFEGKPFRTQTQLLTERSQRIVFDMVSGNNITGFFKWEPTNPALYDLEIELSNGDHVKTYFGMRKIEARDGFIFLNNHPLYQRLILDQGYWDESLLTPPSDEALKADIEWTKKFGYNGARKHQKLEDPRYYYWADKMGLIVWGEIPSTYEFTQDSVHNLSETLHGFIERDFNHPSIITWVPLNESWGVDRILTDKRMQMASEMLYCEAKALDGTRLVSVNDGWEQTRTDIYGLHDYAAYGDMLYAHFADAHTLEKGSNDHRICRAEGYPRGKDEALLVTEYGGIAFADGDEESWGYHDKVSGIESFFERYASLQKALFEIPGCQGYCYTQLTDVQQETNGLLTPDRKPKIDPDRFAKLTTNPPTRYN